MRTITGTIVNVTGTAAANVEVKFTLVDNRTIPITSFVAATYERVYGSYTVTTDSNGDFSISLWENDKLIDVSLYLVQVSLDTDVPFVAALVTGTGSIDWLDFKVTGGPVDPAVLTTIQTYVDAAQAAATAAAASYDSFDDRYLGAKSSDPTVDNDGNPLVEGALYDSTGARKGLKYYNGSTWEWAVQTSPELLTSIKTVDGTGSGLDADLLDGQHGSYYLNSTTGVTLDTTQTITGSKTFDDGTLIAQSAADAPTFGAEMTTNGTFTGGTTGWTLPAEFVYGTDNVIYTVNSVASQMEQAPISVTSGKRYLISWSQTNSAANNGRITPKLGTVDGTECSQGNTVKTNTQILTANTTGTVTFALEGIAYAGGTGTITIDSVSVTEITGASNVALTIKNSSGTAINSIRTTSGASSISMGNSSGLFNTGNYNANFGDSAGRDNTSGSYNTNIGYGSGTYNTTGSSNTNIGNQSGNKNTTGYQNTNNGYLAGYSNTTGYNNVNNGVSSGYSNTTGYQNTNNGYLAGYSNTTGYQNTNNGYLAGYSNTTGYNNINNGYNAGRYLQSGAIAETNTNTSCLGYDSRVSGNNQVQLGNSATTTYVYGTVQNRSDARDKADIRDTALGLDFINLIRPVDYKWNMREDYLEKVTELDEEGNEVEKLVPTENDGSKTRNRYHHGVIAQEVKEACDTLGVDFGGYQDHSLAGGTDVLSIGYDEFVAPLIRAVQELSVRVKELEAKLG